MSDTSTVDPTAPDQGTTTTPPDTGDTTDWKAEAEKWQSIARKHEGRAKSNADAAKELEQFRQQSMTETEKAIEQARNDARREALADVGSKVAAAELRAAAVGRLEAGQIDTLLDGLNLARFIGDDGEVDRDAVTKFVDGIAPKPDDATTAPVLDLGQGTRNQSIPLNGDPLLRDLKSKLGI